MSNLVGLYPVADRLLRGCLSRQGQLEIASGNFRIRIDLGDYTGRRIWAGSFEMRERRFIQKVLRPGGLAVDVGSNIGYLSLTMAGAVGPTGSVLSIEPIPSTFLALEETLRLNRLNHVHCLCTAIGSKQGTVQLSRAPSPSGDVSSGFWRRDDHATEDVTPKSTSACETIITQMRRLDEILTQVWGRDARIDLLKVDTEGMEEDVLMGLGSRLNPRDIRFVLFETTLGRNGFSPSSQLVIERLLACGYSVASIGRRGNLKFIHHAKISRPITTTLNLVAVTS